MGHYDGYYDMKQMIGEIQTFNYLIQQVKEGEFNCLLQAARLTKQKHITIDVDTFHNMLNLIEKMKPLDMPK